ncbi:hypothetical protein AAF712_013072 [Marasmius tenuissimus]|uniref:Uncharacterized protein n=1 Tax=Marasmius tenuissimus TaxID=585030 RepID=A0ABR2ZF19_9AGAR
MSEQLPTTPGASVLAPRMPIEGTRDAPHFNGQYPSDFLRKILSRARAAHIADNDELVDYIYRHSSDRVEGTIRYLPEFNLDKQNKTWDAARKKLLLLFGSTDVDLKVTLGMLRAFVRKHTTEPSYDSRSNVKNCYVNFARLYALLVENKDLSDLAARVEFVKGIPISLREWFMSMLPDEKKTVDSPPTIDEVYDTLKSPYSKKGLFYDPGDDFNSGKNSGDKGNRIGSPATRTNNVAVDDSHDCYYAPLYVFLRRH